MTRVRSATVSDPGGQPSAVVRHRCVRCGILQAAPELFVCGSCREDPATMSEVRNIEEGFTDYREQRKALMLFGWRGGWWR